MRVLYFDCFAGASGDMILGALIAAGVDRGTLLENLRRLDLSGYEIDFRSVDRSGISAIRVLVRAQREQHHRHPSQIRKVLNESGLSGTVKKSAISVFNRLAESEARVHNIAVEEVHFHEIGGMDTIIDIVGACIAFEELKIEHFIASPLNTGTGQVRMEHGVYPVPPPAVVELLKNATMYGSNVEGELLTPTGAAIISTFCSEYGPPPMMRIERVGYGAGARNYPAFPNILRIIVGETDEKERNAEKLMVIETNVDDVSPQVIGNIFEEAFESGALDCYVTPVLMKKNRPGHMISILCQPHNHDFFCDFLFNQTGTLGARSYTVNRRSEFRELVIVNTDYGPINMKVARRKDSVFTAVPEYEECRLAAKRAGVPLRLVHESARQAYSALMGEESRGAR